jgi:ADP-ribose pyrophosphatase YjhB (NUDIX family)
MMRIIQGERVGTQGKLRCGCSALIFDTRHEKILMTRRTDNGRWCLPGGGMDAGESAEEACIREVWEETGLKVQVSRLIGVYSSPDFLIEYADGNKVQVVAMHFEAAVTGGELGLSDETTEAGYYTPAEIAQMDVIETHRQRINDALAFQQDAYFR